MLQKNLALWFGFSLFVSFVAAYVARHTLHPGDDGMLVMRITGTVAFAGYALSHVSDSIWKGQPWANTVRAVVDGAIYALLTGLTFRLLWHAAYLGTLEIARWRVMIPAGLPGTIPLCSR